MVVRNTIPRIEVESASAFGPPAILLPRVRSSLLRLALAVGVGLVARWFYLDYALPKSFSQTHDLTEAKISGAQNTTTARTWDIQWDRVSFAHRFLARSAH